MRSLKHEDGQALVETALSMTLLIIILLGAVEFGRMAYFSVEVDNAAKAAAQYASQTHSTAADLTGITQAAKNEYSTPSALTLVSPASGGFTTANGYACNCSGSTTAVSCTNNSVTSPTCTGSTLEVTITVQTQATYTPGIHIPGFPATYTLNGVAKQKVLQ